MSLVKLCFGSDGSLSPPPSRAPSPISSPSESLQHDNTPTRPRKRPHRTYGTSSGRAPAMKTPFKRPKHRHTPHSLTGVDTDRTVSSDASDIDAETTVPPIQVGRTHPTIMSASGSTRSPQRTLGALGSQSSQLSMNSEASSQASSSSVPLDNIPKPILPQTPFRSSHHHFSNSLLPHSTTKASPILEDTWGEVSVSQVDALVWVKLESFVEASSSDVEERLPWWPAKVTSTSPLSVQLFKAPLGEKLIQVVTHPAPTNVRTFKFPSTSSVRFSFTSLDPKYRACDDGVLWEQALRQALAYDQEENDDLPDPITLTRRTAPSVTSTLSFSQSSRVMDDEDPIPEGPDILLTIPGERVLARSKRSAKEYWPAMIVEFRPATSTQKSKTGRYHVIFFDGFEHDIPREWFYTPIEEGFFTCKLGELQIKESFQEREFSPGLSSKPRSPSPLLLGSCPSASEFTLLPIRAQFTYIRPILQSILRGEYFPARWRHDAFVRGGKRRQGVSRASLSGKLQPREIDEIVNEIRYWSEGGAHVRLDETAPNQRPRGGEEYENFGAYERSQYLADVLLPEALIQIICWREGVRTTADLQSPEEEERINNEGIKFAQQGFEDQWVTELMAVRQSRDALRSARDEENKSFGPSSLPGDTSDLSFSRRARRRTKH